MSNSEIAPVNFSVVPVKRQLGTLQRIYLPPDWQECTFTGKLSVVKLNDGSTYACRVYIKPTLEKNCCLFDDTVNLSPRDKLVEREVAEILPISSTCYLKEIWVRVVVLSTTERNKFLNNANAFKELTKSLLKLLFVFNGAEINFENFDVANKLGIARIIVEEIKPTCPGRVVSSTVLHIKKVVTLIRFKQLKESTRECFSVYSLQYKQLKDFLTFKHQHKSDAAQILVVGPSGSGKKSFVKCVARDCQHFRFDVDCTELLSPEPGQSENLLRERFQEAKQLMSEGPILMQLLRLEVIGCRPSRILNQLNRLLDECRSWRGFSVIATTSNLRRLHESLTIASRLHHTIYLRLPAEEERCELWETLAPRKLPVQVFRELAERTPSYSVADIALILKRARRFNGTNDEFVTCLNDLIRATEPSVSRGELGFIKILDSSFRPVGGLNRIKGILEHAILWPLFYPKLFQKFNLSPSKGLLLYGPPGCAKTSLARTLAGCNRITFLAVSAADLYSPFVGESELIIMNLFKMARAASPSVLFIDEIDALVGRRSDRQKNTQERLLNSFLIEMDGIGVAADSGEISNPQVIVIGATNRPDSLDSALLRPGRLDKLVHVPPPDCEGRLDILKLMTKRVPLAKDVDLEAVARRTELYSGADLGNLSREASLQAMVEHGPNASEVNKTHWMRALEEIKPSLSADQVRWYADFRLGV